MIRLARIFIVDKGISFCNYTMELDGVLKNQPEYYMTKYDKIKNAIQEKGADVAEAITLQANATISAPMED